MKRFILFATVICGLFSAKARGEEYLLRLDNTWSIYEAGDAKKPPDATELRSMEVIVRPNLPFHAKVQVDKETLTFAGKLEPSEKGGFTIDFCHEHVIDTGATIATGINQVKPLLDEWKVDTTLGISVRKPVWVGEMQTAQQSAAHPRRRVHMQQVLHLTPYKPPVK